MSKYYFHICKSGVLEEDPEGAEFGSVDEARNEAILAAREIMAEKVLRGDVLDNSFFQITAEDGIIVLEVPFHAVLRME